MNKHHFRARCGSIIIPLSFNQLSKKSILKSGFLLSFLLFCQCLVWAQLTVSTDNTNARYQAGEAMNFTVSSSSSGTVNYEIKYDNDSPVIESGSINVTANSQTNIPFILNEPGVVFCAVTQGGSSAVAVAVFSPFDIQPLEPEPADLDAFWDARKAELAAIPMNPQLTFHQSHQYGTTHRLELSNIDGRKVYGYISIPSGSGPFPAIVTMPPAGNEANLVQPEYFIAERSGVISVTLSIHNVLPNLVDPNGYQPDDISDPNGIYYKYALLGAIRTFDYLFTRSDFDGENLGVVGVSQGGGLAMILAGLDQRVKLLACSNPSHGQHVGLKYDQASPYPFYVRNSRAQFGTPQHEAATVAATKYYDAMYFTKRYTGPSLVVTSYEDDVVPAATVFAAINQLQGTNVVVHARDLGHTHPSEYWDGRYDFFRKHFPATLNPPWPWPSTTTGYFANAGSDLTIPSGGTANLSGSVQVNDVENNSFPVEWKLVQGPGTVNFSNPNAKNTSATFSTDGSYVFSFTAHDETTLAGQAKFVSMADRVTITVGGSDTTPPAVTLTGPSAVNGEFDVSVTFSEPVSGLAANDFSITNGTASNLSGTGQNYSLTVTPTAAGNVGISLPADSADDAAGNGNTASNTLNVTYSPPSTQLTLACPNDVVVTTAPGESTIAATWADPTTSTTCSDPNVTLTQTAGPAKGSQFPIGTTAISYQATDNCSNAETCSFSVIVQDGGPGGSGTLNIVADRANARYDAGENMNFLVTANYNGTANYTIKYDNDSPIIESGTINVSPNSQTNIPFVLNEPGSVFCTVSQGNGFGIAGVVFSPLDIQPLESEPTDFDAFWNARKAELAAVPINPQVSFYSDHAYATTHQFNLGNIDGRKVYGYITIPDGAGPFPAIITMPSFGNDANLVQPEVTVAERGGVISVALSILNVPPNQVDPAGYTPDIINDPEGIFYKYAMLAGFRAIDYLFTRPDFDGENVGVVGVSQGGGLAILLAGLDDRVKLLACSNPSHGEHTGLKYDKASAFPYYIKQSRQLVGTPTHEAQTIAASKYYDAIYCANRYDGPAYFLTGLLDDVNPPATVFASFNQLKGSKVMYHSRDLNHLQNPNEYWSGRFDFFRKHFPATLNAPWPWTPTTTGYFADAGTDLNVSSGGIANLSGSVQVNGTENNSFPVEWKLVQGPGTVNFSSANAKNTTVTFSTDGTYIISFTAFDETTLAGQAKFVSMADQITVTVGGSDTTPPSVTLTGPATVNGAFDVSVSFSEPVTGLALNDFSITNGTANNLSGSGQNFTFSVLPTNAGDVSISLPADSADDAAGNGNTASNTLTVTYSPPSTQLTLSCPSDVVVTTAPGESMATATWADPTISTTCSNPNVTLTQTAGLASGSQFPIGTTAISYQATDNCSNVETCSFSVTVQDGGPGGDYCDAQGNEPWAEWIAQVQFNTIDNPSFKELYGDFTAISTDVAKGNSYPLALTPGFSWLSHDEHWRVWIDFNRDFDFDDAGEIVFSQNGTSIMTATINIPATAATGTTRMRVAMKRDAFPTSCETFILGEVEDYTLNILDNGGDTTPPEVTISTASNTVTGDFTVDVVFSENVTGLTANDFTIANGSAGNMTGSGDTYALTVNPAVEGTINISLPANSADDAAGNGNMASNALNVTYSPPSTQLTLTCPGDVVVTTAPGESTATATWADPTTSTTCSNPNVTLAQTTGPAKGSQFSIGTTAISYQATDNCSNVETCSFSVTVQDGGSGGDYCDAQGNEPWAEWIAQVQFNTIDNPSFKELYGDFTAISTDVTKGNSYPITLTPGFSWLSQDEHWRVWIDFNQDFDFDDAGEMVFSQNGTSVLSANIAIPSSATTGTTRMRVAMKRDAFPSPCETFMLGEVEDYSVNILDSGGGGDTTPPDVSLSTSSNSVSGNFTVDVNFSEDVTGLTANNFIITNGTAGNLTGSGDTYALTVNPIAEGTVSVSLPTNSASDAAGNGNTASNTLTVTYTQSDTTPPTVTLSTANSNVSGSFTVDVVFSENVTGLTANDFTIANGSAGNISGNGSTYALLVNPVVEGTVSIFLSANAAADAAGNGNIASNIINVEYTLSQPCDIIDLLPQTWTDFANGGIYSYNSSNQTATFISIGGTLTGKEILFSDIGFVPDAGQQYELAVNVISHSGGVNRVSVYVANSTSNLMVANLKNIEGTGEQTYPLNLAGRDRFRLAGQGGGPTASGSAIIGTLEIRCVQNSPLVGNADFSFEFNAEKDGRYVVLDWFASNNSLVQQYTLERSANGTDFSELLTVQNTSDDDLELYWEIDWQPALGDNFYRIKQVLKDGSEIYSDFQKVFFDIDLNEISLFPNPADKYIKLNLRPFSGKRGDLQVYNQLGQQLSFIEIEEIPGLPIVVRLDDYKEGYYFLKISIEGHKSMTLPFVVAQWD